MITNNNDFYGEAQQININIVIVNTYNFPPPVIDQSASTLKKKKSEFWKTKFMPLMYSIVKWSYKFGAIFFL